MNIADALAAVVILGAVFAAAVLLFTTRSVGLSVATLLDFFGAATLLRLAGEPSWPALGETAAIFVVRQVIRGSLG